MSKKDADSKENTLDYESDASDFQSVGALTPTTSPPQPIRESENNGGTSRRNSPPVPTPSASPSEVSTTSSVESRLGHLEDQKKKHSKARKSQAAMNTITSMMTRSKGDAIHSPESVRSQELIQNKPKTESYDEEEKDDLAAEDVLNAELISEEESSARDVETVVKNAIADLVFFAPFMALPSLFVYLFSDCKSYNIVSVKGPEGLNWAMEFIRYNIFITMAFVLYVIFDVLSLVVPESVLIIVPLDSKNPWNKFVRKQMNMLVGIRKHVRLAAWSMSLLFLAGTVLYKSMMITPFETLRILSEAKAVKMGKNEEKTLIAQETQSLMNRNLEVFLALLSVFSLVFAMEKYLIETIALNFHRIAFAEKISQSNIRYSCLNRIYEAVKFGKPRILSKHSPLLSDLGYSMELRGDGSMNLTSAHRAKSIARTIYRSLLPADDGEQRDYLTVEDFEKYTAHPKETFEVFDLEKAGKLTALSVEEFVLDVYSTRVNLLRGLLGNGRIIRKLNGFFKGLAVIIASIISSPIFDTKIGELIASLGIISATVGFMLNSTAKTWFESIIFVFIQHSFDVGDRVIIDDEVFIVDDIEIITTKLVRWDGTTVYVTNSLLSSKYIHNINRSGNQMESVSLKLEGATSTKSLIKFKETLEEVLKADANSFTGVVDFSDLSKFPSGKDPLTLNIFVQVNGNFQNNAKRSIRKAKLMDLIDETLRMTEVTKV